jgi:hypothetical protein
MRCNDYHLVTRWRIPGTVDEVAAISHNVAEVVRWWPAVYLQVEELAPGDADRVGMIVRVMTKGWLPYTLRWTLRVVEAHYPYTFTIDVWGDLAGRGVCTIAQAGDAVRVTYDWRVRAEKPLLRLLSCVLKPIFAANHAWAMRMGERSLRLEVARRRAATAHERALVPAAPPPMRGADVLLAAAGAGALVAATALVAWTGLARLIRGVGLDTSPNE